MTLQAHPYADFIQKVMKPARYLGGEYQSVTKDWDSVQVRICLAFPDLYDIGMSHLGTKILYSLLNRHADIACERAFAPWTDMEAELRTRGLPVLSLESARPLRDFDVVGFSLQYEMTFTNLLNLLDLSGLPLRTKDRPDTAPLIIAGGPTATHPEPIAPFVDAFLVGDAEELLPRSLLAIARARAEGRSRREVLLGLAELGGWYCPSLYEREEDERSGLLVVRRVTDRRAPLPVRRAFVEDISRYRFPTDAPVAAAEAIFDRMSVEIARGCTEGCRFCQAGMIYRPVRERDPAEVVEVVLEAIRNGGYDEVSLTSLSTADYSCISPLLKRVVDRLREEKATLSVSSLRAYGLAEDLLDEISSVKATGLTFAPEAGTQRMRDVVNKNITEADLLTTAERVFSRGWNRMKLYFMIGLPTEQDEDVLGIVETAARARDVGIRHQRKVEVTASVSSHVPKPHTPFQWAAMDGPEEIERKQALLRGAAREHRVKLRHHDARVSWIEGIIARGDARVADLIEAAWRKGCRFDGWDDQLRFDAWKEAISETGLDPQHYLRTLPVDGGLPWDHLDVGLEPGFLAQEYKRALKDRLSPPCGKPKGMQVHHTNLQEAEGDTRKLVCYHCGVACDLTQMREERIGFLTKLEARLPSTPQSRPAPWRAIRKDARGRNLPPAYLEPPLIARYRLVFTKLGHAALQSQLDLIRAIPRILRRASLALRYTQGFSPRPFATYGPALPLGTPSLYEVADIDLTELIGETELLARLAPVSDPGIGFAQAAQIPLDARSCARAAKLAEFMCAAPGLWDEARLEAAAAHLRGLEPVLATVHRKAGPRVIDVRDGLLGAWVDLPTDRERELLDLREGPVLRWRTHLDRGAHVRPSELARAAVGEVTDAALRVARVRLSGLDGDRVYDILAPPAKPANQVHSAQEAVQDLPVA
jgi:radical SAM family uncharacterized protein/radical SAM-linked protein